MQLEVRKLKVGDILTYSWGYDQTNVDAYQVVRESKASVWIRAIALEAGEATGPFSGRVRPVRDKFLSDQVLVKRRRSGYRGDEIVVMPFGVGSLWHGERDLHCSWGH